MSLRSLLPSDTPGKICLSCGAGALLIGMLFTFVAVGAILTGNTASMESSRPVNRVYAILSACGEAVTAVGFVAGASALLRRRQLSFGLAIGLALNLVGLILFLPATLVLLVNSFFGLLDYLSRSGTALAFMFKHHRNIGLSQTSKGLPNTGLQPTRCARATTPALACPSARGSC